LALAATGTNSALLIPRDTTANRPAGNVTNGMIRYNTNTNKFEFYENDLWVNYNTGAAGGGSVSWPLTASPNTTSAASPQYTFGGSTTTGMFSPGTTTLSFATAGS